MFYQLDDVRQIDRMQERGGEDTMDSKETNDQARPEYDNASILMSYSTGRYRTILHRSTCC